MAPRLLRELNAFKKTIILVLTPLVLLPLPLVVPTTPARCGYGVAVMAIYWTTEVIPMAVTALLPIVLFPVLGVRSSKDICKNYLKDTNMLFVGGLIVAVAVEKWNLHKRIALRVLLILGSKPKWLMFGFMTTTAFLSMWISNTATTAMMVPIAQGVLSELNRHQDRKEEEQEEYLNIEMKDTSKPDDDSTLKNHHHNDRNSQSLLEKKTNESESNEPLSPGDQSFQSMCKGVTLCIAYAANIGGTATLTGTGPNLIVKGQVDTLFGSESRLNFSSWFILAFPNMVVSLILAWIWLQIMYIGPRSLLNWRCSDGGAADTAASRVIRSEYDKLGPMSFAEVAVLIHFTTLAVLWITREPEFMPGWSVLFKDGYVTDASIGITIATLLFFFPSKWPNFMCCRKSNDSSSTGPREALLDWETVCRKLPWGVVLVLGGGFALADACKASGLSRWIGQQFTVFEEFPVWLMVLLICIIVAVFTEVASNTATATIFLPILAELAVSIKVNPLYLMLPCAISTSFAFMLPVATPPNAIVFAYGHLRIKDMVKCGVFMNLICICILTLSINTYGMAYFKLDQFPKWAWPSTPSPVNQTSITNFTTPAYNFTGS